MISFSRSSFIAIAALILLALVPAAGLSQTAPSGLKVFLSGPEASAYAADLGFVVIVQNREEADMIVEINPAPGAGPIELLFLGQGKFQGKKDSLKYQPAPGEKPEDVRKGVSRLVQLGLLRFAAETPAAARIDVVLQDQVKPTAVNDPWNFWVFSLSANGFLMGDDVYKNQEWFFSASANRVTPDWKIQMSGSYVLNHNSYDYEGFVYESESRSKSATGLIARSLGEHWSIGAVVSASSSTYNNQKLYFTLKPAIEYDVFKYSESTKKQLCFLYYAGPETYHYAEETIFDKRRETLWKQALTVALDLIRPWGTMSVSLSGSHYFHDVTKNRLELYAKLSWRIFKGLNFDIYGGGARIRDQFALPKGGASYEEVLLRRKQLATGYSYYFSVGLSYTFGSVLSNIVNPRLSSGGGTSISISM